jgi:hypothetical protein
MKNMKLSAAYFSCLAGIAAFAAVIYAASVGNVFATETNAPPQTISISNSTNAPAKPEKKVSEPARKLTGVELYAIHCNRCHPERYPTEFNEGEWKTIMMHMRVRANLDGADAREIMQYLREEGGN